MKKNYVSPVLFCDEYVADTLIASCNASNGFVGGAGCENNSACYPAGEVEFSAAYICTGFGA